MTRFLLGTRYLILVPILGLAIAATFFFIFGGISLISLLVELLLDAFGFAKEAVEPGEGVIIFEVVEHVHIFLIGTVLYITAVGLYQLFIHEIDFPEWLKIDNTEELETNLIGVTVVVLAVNFMGAIFVGGTDNLLQYGAGIALPIAALGVFVALRAWSVKITKEAERSEEVRPSSFSAESEPQEVSESE
jgi:uncharacterized membrane protein YqhA